jgi:hypothetical protein
MNAPPADLLDLFDDYLAETLGEERLAEVEARLRGDAEARAHFVRYCGLHTDLHLEARASRAGQRALDALERASPTPGPRPRRRRWLLPLAAAAALLLAAGVWWWLSGDRAVAAEPIAWLVNAQDCRWADNEAPAGDMFPGKVLRLDRGLAEIRFRAGARVLLEGPARLVLSSGNGAELAHGKLTAQVPASAKGFEISSPRGKVTDEGTEFAMSVASDGATDVYVYAGKVEARAGGGTVSVQEKQAARIDATGVSLQPAGADPGPFVRTIVPAPKIVPRTLTLDFRSDVPGTLADTTGQGTGLTHRLPGTGKALPPHDRHLRLNRALGQLELTTTNTDLNTSFQLERGEYLGVRLADLGFTGKEDFALTVVVPDIPDLRKVGQFGLYAGLDSKRSIRGGMIGTKEPNQYKQFLVLNRDGKDVQPHFVGAGFAGDDLRLTLRREAGRYTLTVENQTTGNATTIKGPPPDFLEGRAELYVGFFGANTQSNDPRTLKLKEFQVTVWTVAGP